MTGADAGVGALVDEFGRSSALFMQASGRDKFTAPLFNVPGRLVVGSHCFVEHLPDVLAAIENECDAATLGHRMRKLGTRPNYVNLSALLFGYLNGREQLGLIAGSHPDEVIGHDAAERTARVVGFWQRALTAYLAGAPLLPEQREFTLPLLSDDEVRGLENVGDPLDRAARKLVAVAELYTFALNGEARIGVLHHGPYPLGDGTQLLVKELVGLRDNEIGWRLADDIGIDALVRVQRLPPTALRVDLFGSLQTAEDLAKRVLGERLFAVTGGGPVELDEASVERLTAALNAATLGMYRQSITWSSTEQVSYGWKLYAGLVIALARCAGADLRDDIRARFEETSNRVTPGIESGVEPLLVLQRLGSAEQPYSPLSRR